MAQSKANLEEANRELQRSNKELEQFAYVASHDLQEPLRMVTAYTQLFATRYAGKIDEESSKYIRYATDGAIRAQQLIRDLLEYSSIRHQEKAFEKIDCERILGAVLSNLALAVQESGAVITHGKLPVVMGDKTKLMQLFQNLISNALKFRKDEAPAVHIEALRENGFWHFSFRDNGIGIEPRYHERIFTIFQRLHGSKEYAGTGIGLAICKKIAEQHGGRIWLESELGKGSVFHVTIKDKDEP
jgi:light-regulated signal transduction histidine kinase (bacteriophytochrome)